ncbi:MAG TPA: DUF4242 domain-containing protein [Nitriliruptorales bacterium]
MALFMDVHTLGPGLSVDDVVAAHEKDLEIQTAYGVNYTQAWVDHAKGKIFCLAEGPDAETVSRVHKEGHGLVADEIFEVSQY